MLSQRNSKLIDITEKECRFICDQVIDIFKSEPMLLEIKPPLNICGTFIDKNI
jgi:hypothetical protein